MAGEMDFEIKNIGDSNIDIEKYRKLVRSYLDLHQYNSALFWADKVVSLSNDDPRDIYWLAQCMFLLRQYHRAAHLIRSRELDKSHTLCHYLAVKSLLEAGDLADALKLLTTFEENNSTQNESHDTAIDAVADLGSPVNLQSSILFLKGRVLEGMDNRALAADCYRQALKCDVYCFEAFDALIQHHMLSVSEEYELLDSIPYYQQCSSPTEASFLRNLYKMKLNKYQGPHCIIHVTPPGSPTMNLKQISTGSPEFISTGKDSKDANVFPAVDSKPADSKPSDNVLLQLIPSNLDVIVSQAERLYYHCKFHQSLKLTEEILNKDPYHNGCLPVHIGCLVELKKTNNLFYLAHKLVDLHPEMAISWFAVGCYYYLIGKSDNARRYLNKATGLDRLFGPAWLAFGHSFAAENEHDQAMAAYFKSSQLMKGCHLPLLYIGLECGLTNNGKLADKFFIQAQSIAPFDPFVMHEMGVIAFQNQDYKNAHSLFEEALCRVQAIDQSVPEKWEPLLNNLGHVCRKSQKFREALYYHQKALVLRPLNPSTYSAMGYAHAMLGNTAEAVDCFHKALGLRRDDTFSTTMLNYVIEQLMDEPFQGAPEKMPVFKPKTEMRSKPNRIITFDDNSCLDLEGRNEESTASDQPIGTDSINAAADQSSCLSFDVEMQDTSSKAPEDS